MRLSYLAYSLSLVLFYFSIMLVVPLIIGLIFHETNVIIPFATAILATALLSLVLRFVKGVSEIKSINDIKKSEGLCIVTFSWLLAGLFASIPYLFFGLNPLDSIFEASAGITTTGSTVFTHFDYPKAIFFWRSFSQWLGGMGIIVLFIAVLPQFAIAGRQLFFAEAPGPTEEKFTPRIKNTASSLWKIYTGFTIIEIILLKLNGMSWFNSLCCSLSSVSGGGFYPESASLIGSASPILWIVCFFMFLSGTNYSLQYRAIIKHNPLIMFKNEEFKTYFLVFVSLSILLAGSLFLNSHYDIWNSLTHGIFQISSIISTSAFCSVDFANWDYTSKAIVFVAMLTGSCASSAGGGIKILRWLLIFKIMKTELVRILHPKAVFNIKIGQYSVPQDILYQTLMFVSFYFLILGASALLISVIEHNTALGVTGAIGAIGNIGPGLSNITGPVGSYATLNPISKIIIIIDMYIGRLELIPFLILFQKEIWRGKG